MDMTHRTSSSNLKARMGQYMRAVRAGGEVVVTDRDEPVARLVPYREVGPGTGEELQVARAKDPGAPIFSKVKVHPIKYRGRSTTALLEADRKRR
jgi:prevent-host-death family protein